MSDTKWSPGPWTAKRAYFDDWVEVCDSDGATLIRFRRPSEQDLVDVHLIAAAPMLYEALERASGLLKLHMPEATAAIRESEAALAAARGEQS